MGVAHVHHWALRALVAASGQTKSEIGRRAQLTPAGIGDLLSGRAPGLSDDIRARLADALATDIEAVTVEAVTCWCDDQTRHKGN